MEVLEDKNNSLPKAKVVKAIAEFRRENFIKATGKNQMIKSNIGGIKYATLNDVLKVLEGTNKFGIEWYQNFNSPYLMTTIMHLESGEYIESIIELKTEKETYHSYGSAISYLRRYSLITMFGLQDSDDDGNMTLRGKPKPKNLENYVTSDNSSNGGVSSSSTIASLKWALADCKTVQDVNKYYRENYKALGKTLSDEEQELFVNRKGELA
tara:strand:+ start:3504 stop:4136 length:633 start_codon:yes stop_codon:yes gene_type:complete